MISATASARTLWYVTVRYPTGRGEEFLSAEIDALGHESDITVIPLRPARGSNADSGGLAGPKVLLGALGTLARHPLRSVGALITIVATAPRNAIRNLAVLPRALYLAGRVPPGAWLHAAWATTPATACFIIHRITGRPWGFSAHRHDVAARNLLAAKGRSASFVRAISERTASDLRGVGVDSTKIAVIHVGVEVPHSREVRPSGARPPVILCPGALIPRKNQKVLIAAMAREEAGDLHLLLAGEGPERTALALLAKELRVTDRVDLLGHVPHDELLSRYRDGHVRVVALSSTDEGIPVSLMEALAHGVPVVTSAVGGVTELVDPRVGVVVRDADDPAAFARALATAAGWDPLEVARAAESVIATSFDATASARRLAELMWKHRDG